MLMPLTSRAQNVCATHITQCVHREILPNTSEMHIVTTLLIMCILYTPRWFWKKCLTSAMHYNKTGIGAANQSLTEKVPCVYEGYSFFRTMRQT